MTAASKGFDKRAGLRGGGGRARGGREAGLGGGCTAMIVERCRYYLVPGTWYVIMPEIRNKAIATAAVSGSSALVGELGRRIGLDLSRTIAGGVKMKHHWCCA